jgi:Xaa-Pro dipeptidase
MDPKIVAKTLKELQIDCYVIYDFRGSNHVGRGILNFHTPTTRRWVAIYSSSGNLHLIIPRLELSIFANVKAEVHPYTTYEELYNSLKEVLKDQSTIALDYSSANGLSILDVVPAGFMELLKKINSKAKFISSGDITQYLSSRWGSYGFLSNKKAAQVIKKSVDETIKYIKTELRSGHKITDLQAEEFVLANLKKGGVIVQDDLCIVSTNQRASNPHYWPTQKRNTEIKPNSVILFDVWGKLKKPGSIYADCTFMGWIGPKSIPKNVLKVWEIVRDARNLGVEFVKENINKDLKGYQVDRVVRDFIEKQGYGEFFIHRTGHSIDTNDHGSGANIDDFESKDERRILPDTGFSIEPGIYLKEFGVRSEIDVYVHPDKKIEVTSFLQEELFFL